LRQAGRYECERLSGELMGSRRPGMDGGDGGRTGAESVRAGQRRGAYNSWLNGEKELHLMGQRENGIDVRDFMRMVSGFRQREGEREAYPFREGIRHGHRTGCGGVNRAALR
jgi:hypothetical protein